MINKTIKFILILLFIFTPIAFGSMEIWAFSLMELGILLIIILWAIQNLVHDSRFAISNLKFQIPYSFFFPFFSVSFSPDDSYSIRDHEIISPKTYELRHALSISDSAIFDSKF